MKEISLGQEFLQELEAEVPSTRKCLERIPFDRFDFKPHEKSMNLGYLTQLVAEIPRWISLMIKESEIDFATFKHDQPKDAADLLKLFEQNLDDARQALKDVTNEALQEKFYLKNQGQILDSSVKKESVSSTLNHWVHHRGQLTVYMRLNDIPVPSIYGPSADDRSF